MPSSGRPWSFSIRTSGLKRWFYLIRCWQLVEESQYRRFPQGDNPKFDLADKQTRRILSRHIVGSHLLGLLLVPKLLLWPSHYDVRMLVGFDSLLYRRLAAAAARRLRPSLWRRLLGRIQSIRKRLSPAQRS